MNNLDQVKRIFDISIYQRDRYDLDSALSHRARGEWESISSRQYVERIDRAARALVAAGIEKGDRVGIISGGHLMVTGKPEELKTRYGAANLEEVFERVVLQHEVH